MRKRLAAAVAAEDYERAAKLRDEIQDLEQRQGADRD
jgi:protein-arginine kinase activator protein McsA